MQSYCAHASLPAFVACVLVMGTAGCSPGSGTAVPGGATGTGGAPGTASTSDCVEGRTYPRSSTFCKSDADCATDSSCSGAVQGDSFTCIHGSLEPSSFILVPVCELYPSSCMLTGSAIKSYLTDNDCTVMVRVSADTNAIVGYAVNCGVPTVSTAADVLDRLMQMNSINWSGATNITDSQTTGVIAFTVANGPASYTAYFSASTGNQLLTTQTLDADAGTGGFQSDIIWHDAADLGTLCTSTNYLQPVSFGSNMSQTELDTAGSAIRPTNLIPTLRMNIGPIDSVSVTPINVGEPEFLFFVNALCSKC